MTESQELRKRRRSVGCIGSWETRIGPESVFTWSPETYRIFGIEEGTAVRNFDFFNLVHPEDRQLLVETMIKVRNDKSRAELKVRLTRPDGSPRVLVLTARPELDAAGAPVGLRGTVEDVTEAK